MRKVIALLLAVLLLGSLATVCFADDYEGGSVVVVPKFTVHIIYDFPVPEDGGTTEIPQGNQYVITPKDKEGFTFEGYEITGEYEIISKDGNKWTIVPLSDLTIHVKYKNVKPEDKPVDDKPVSPSTGFNTVLFGALILFGLCGVAVATRKLVKNH